jgi:hypothetical protein
VLFDRSNWPQHRPWLFACLLVLIGAIAWFVVAGLDQSEWPGGSSLPGFTFGVVGALIILFECLLWLRRKVRVWRIGSAQVWLRAHIWLGLLCLPILILHSGIRHGGTLSTTLMVLLVLVIASGIWGLILQNRLPRRMIDDLPTDATFAQMNSLVLQLVGEAEQLVSATCGSKIEASDAKAEAAVVGVIRIVRMRPPATLVQEAEPLAVFYREQVAPFLRDGTSSDSPLNNANDAAALFRNCKAQLPPAAHETVDVLECYCQQRRHWDRQARLHFWLHCWLWVHFPLSAALVVLMATHVFVALKYW